ncbi:MAG: hypothetical protein HY459_00320 [Parcubacteria group bacterium]|nr:hypothetical protein [Parcubacteria group bacterium]
MSNIGLDHLEAAMGPESRVPTWIGSIEKGGEVKDLKDKSAQKIREIIATAKRAALSLKQELDRLPPAKRARTVKRLLDTVVNIWS